MTISGALLDFKSRFVLIITSKLHDIVNYTGYKYLNIYLKKKTIMKKLSQ